jgi:hypothetical protein
MRGTVFWVVTNVVRKRPDVLEEHIASICRVEEQAKEETIKKAGGK